MRDWYDQPMIDEILKEQAERLPNGPLGVMIPPKVEIEDRDAEVMNLWTDYTTGKISTMDFMIKAEELKKAKTIVLTR